MHDCVQPFLFEHLDIRGAVVSLDRAWLDLTAHRHYPPAVAALLGEMSAVTCLIAANLKQPGRMTFQMRGNGAVNLLVLDCDESLNLRGMARHEGPIPEAAGVTELLGDGQLLLSLDAPSMRQPWQSLVPLEGGSIAAAFQQYLDRSEQQPTRVLLAADAHRAVGLLAQKLPETDARDKDGWNRINHLLNTLSSAEQLSLPPQELLHRLFPEEVIRVFPPRPLRHHCPDDPAKIHAMLRSLGRAECDAVLMEKGVIHVRDDICDRDYRFGAADLEAIFSAPGRMH